MKNILRLMGILALTIGATIPVVACNNNSTPTSTQLDGKYATLLGWYDVDNTTSKIEQKLLYTSSNYAVTVDNNLIITPNLFKTKLLAGTTTNTATNADAATFLSDLGFMSGNTNTAYNTADVNAITSLVATVKTTNPGTIVDSTTDFKITTGSCQVDIMTQTSGGTLVKSYIINTVESDLKITDEVGKILTQASDLKLTIDTGFQKNASTSGFKLEFTSDTKQILI